MAYTFDAQIVSDLHKDARGFRPSEYFWEEWDQCGDDNRQAMWDSLCRELEETMAAERDAEAGALRVFTKRVIDTQLAGAGDLRTAIRWILEGEQFDDMDYCYGADYCAFHFGLAYNNPFREDFAAVCAAKAEWRHQEEAA